MSLKLSWPGKCEYNFDKNKKLVENSDYSFGEKSENMIIQGDNLEALHALLPAYKGRVKCIYIDPPYNTKSAFEHYNDNLEHTQWLQMMYPRLEVLRDLLAEDGSIWVSIDDNECHYLKVIMDEVFGRVNFISTLPTIMNLKGNQDKLGFAGTHEYTIVYAKDKKSISFNQLNVDEETILKEWKEDEYGLYKEADNLRATGVNSPREKRPNLWYPIFIDESEKYFYTTNDDKKESYSHSTIFPVNQAGNELSWYWSKPTFNTNKHNLILKKTSNGWQFYKKQRPKIGDCPTKKPKSFFYDQSYSSSTATLELKKLFGEKKFNYPKPEPLIRDFMFIATKPGDIILDSFLGSGTTAAVAHKMGRRYIGIEMGEHAKTHCAKRLQKVIEGEQGGISKSVNWKGGGGFKFYETR